MDVPFFTIIIPTYNRAKFICTAIDSVIHQTNTDWQLIIVDDGSIDNTKQLVLDYSDARIQYIYQENQERCVARNIGINHAKGKYICFLDSDDYFLPDRLERLYNEILLQHELVAMFYTGICFQNTAGVKEKVELAREDYFSIYDFVVRAVIGAPQTCIASEILQRHKFNPLFTISEDMELWLRIANEYPIIYFPDQFTVIATEHEDRSVNVLRKNIYKEVLIVFRFIKKNYRYTFSKRTTSDLYCDCHFGIAKYYIYQKRPLTAIKSIVLSILYDIKGKQVKYKLNIGFNLVFNYKKALHLIEKR